MMADRRVMRGSRLGALSYETDRNHDLAPRKAARYRTENGEEFDMPFAHDAEVPGAHTLGHAAGTPLDRGTRRTAQRTPRDYQVTPPRQLA
jgi:hypothetical protein